MTTRNMNRQSPSSINDPSPAPTPTPVKPMVPKAVSRTSPPCVPIVIDTRERQPWAFTVEIDNAVSTRGTLATGDYSVRGYETRICVERKSLIDWVSTIVNHHDRFHKELIRMKDYDRSFIIIECTLKDIAERKYEVSGVRRNIDPSTIRNMSIGIMLKYPWVQVIFADDRYEGKCACLTILRQYWKTREMAKEANR